MKGIGLKDWVKEKLDRIDELFPGERICRAKKRLTDLWNGVPAIDRHTFTQAMFLFNYYNDIHTAEERLRFSLDEILMRGYINDDFIPSIFPGCKMSSVPSMFGDFSGEKVINTESDIDNFPDPIISHGSTARDWLDMQKYFLEETEGRLPIHVTDTQGPSDIVGQMWGYDNMFAAAYEEPENYHKIMSKVTEAVIVLWNEQKRLLGDNLVPTHLFGWSWVPHGNGITLSADSIVMVSPTFFDEYYKPYFDIINKEMGWLTIHSCGDFSHIIKALNEIPYIKAINAGEMTIPQIVNAGLDNKTIAIASSGIDNIRESFDAIRNNNLSVDLSVYGIWPIIDGKAVKLDDMTNTLWHEMKEREQKIVEAASVK